MRLHQLRSVLEGVISGLAGEFSVTVLPREERITWHINEGQADALVVTIAEELIALLRPVRSFVLPYGDGDVLRLWAEQPKNLIVVIDRSCRKYHLHPGLRTAEWQVQVIGELLTTYIHLQRNYRCIWGRRQLDIPYQLDLSSAVA